MTEIGQKYDELRKAVEKIVGCDFNSPKDFDMLAQRLLNLTQKEVSSSTLQRFWGYKEKDLFSPRQYTLNALAVLAGYGSWKAFCTRNDKRENASSGFIFNKVLKSSCLTTNDRIRLIWSPDRTLTAKFLGRDLFIVEECVNCKLQKGDFFNCSIFVENEQLILSNIIRKKALHPDYVCGKIDGVKFTVIPQNGGVDNNLCDN